MVRWRACSKRTRESATVAGRTFLGRDLSAGASRWLTENNVESDLSFSNHAAISAQSLNSEAAPGWDEDGGGAGFSPYRLRIALKAPAPKSCHDSISCNSLSSSYCPGSRGSGAFEVIRKYVMTSW